MKPNSIEEIPHPLIGQKFYNAYGQEVEVVEVSDVEVVFYYIAQDSVDVMDIEDFKRYLEDDRDSKGRES